MAELLKGAPVAAALTERLAQRCAALKEKGVEPTLAILRVGDKPGDLSYEAGAVKRCDKVGIAVRKMVLPAEASREDVLGAIRHINDNPAIHGCLMFRPLADRETELMAIDLLDPAKDVDCMTAISLTGIFLGMGKAYAPCTPQACIEILDHYGIDPEGANVVVIGRSRVVGKPLSMLLQSRNATVTMCHTKTRDLAGICRRADIIVAAAGSSNMVSTDFVREGQVVIDVGINVDATGKLCGDVDFEAVEPIVAAITPVPGGVGAVTTSVLAEHVISAAERRLEESC